MTAPVRILCINSGSSSLKLALYAGESRVAACDVEGIGLAAGRLVTRDATGGVTREEGGRFGDARAALRAALDRSDALRPEAIGHRVVHGGAAHEAPELVTPRLIAALQAIVPLAPLHMPAALDGIDAAAALFPRIPQVACFDTAFHRAMPAVAHRLPLPRALAARGVQRYGFHGLSYEYVVATLGASLGRGVIAHLGNGASLAAVRDGRPVDTTMGFTPAGGLMMGTRSGELDPGVMLYLLAHEGCDAASLARLVQHESGLLGVSGTTSDMKTLLEVRDRDPHAAEAVELFCYVLRKHIGAFAAVLGGIDTLVFTGGIGAHAAAVREEACRGLAHLGIRIDGERNVRDEPIISVPGGACTVRTLRTDEDLMIARHTRRVVGLQRNPHSV
jgi:acetate kinase